MIKNAIIYSFTEIFSASVEFQNRTPYINAILEADGERFVAFIEGERSSIEIGATVIFKTTDEDGNAIYSSM